MTAMTTTPSPLEGLKSTVGPELFDKILKSKVLLVGAGGIGCELLKNLALSGFGHVEVIDLDTIDVSNLNRQFLFRMKHVGMPKCTVACQATLNMAFREDAQYMAHHGNVCDNTKFNVQYVSQFDLVLNALDNLTARRRVNRLCLAAGVPLIEAGTTGYLGQVTVIDKASNVECYECQAKPTQKVYPICTIRSTPSMPVHTIVWAKELYKLLFGPKVEDSMLHEDMNGEEPSTYMKAVMDYRAMVGTKADQSQVCKAASTILTTLYHEEIEKQIKMDRYKTAKMTPKPLSADDIAKGTASSSTCPTKSPSFSATAIWSNVECIAEFTACLVDVSACATLLPEFDKDDDLAMRFVTASSNLRSQVFGIEPLQSLYSAKGIAGNIIPAIATTNAIVAGLQVLQAFHILQVQQSKANAASAALDQPGIKDVCRYTYCAREKTRKGLYLIPTKLPDPNPKCFVCRNATISLTLNVHQWTLQSLLDKIIKAELGFEEPTIMLEGDIIHEEGQDADSAAFAVNLTKVLSKLPCGGIQQGTIVRVEDFSQDLEVDVCVTHKEVWEEQEEEEEYPYVVGGDKPTAAKQSVENRKKDDSSAKEAPAADSDDDDIEIVEPDAKPTDKEPLKRPIDMNSENPVAKKQRLENGKAAATGAVDVIEID